jgi:hypothetical protein
VVRERRPLKAGQGVAAAISQSMVLRYWFLLHRASSGALALQTSARKARSLPGVYLWGREPAAGY